MPAFASDAYLQSLNASQADVTRHLQTALNEIARQRQVAGAQVSQIPGATNNAVEGAEDGLFSMLQPLGLQPMPSLVDAFQNTSAAYGRSAGLLNQGFGEQQTRRTGAAKSVAEQLRADIQAKAAEQQARRQQEERERAFQAQMAAQQRALQQELAAQAQAAAAQNAAAEQQAEYLALLEFLGLNPDGSSVQQPMIRPTSAPTKQSYTRRMGAQL